MTVKISKIQQRLKANADRKQLIKENLFWDDLKQTHDLSEARALAMLNQVSGLTGAFSNPENKIFGYIQKPKELATHTQAYLADIRGHLTKLDQIYAMHKDRSGGFVVEQMNDEMRLHLNCMDQYKAASDVYDTVITPGINHIVEIFAAAEMLMNKDGLFLTPENASVPPSTNTPVTPVL